MKLVAFCLFAVCCFFVSTTAAPVSNLNKLKETQKDIDRFWGNLTSIEKELKVKTPPNNFQECGCLSALACFQRGVSTFNSNDYRNKLIRSLGHKLTIEGLTFCDRESNASCSECQTHPSESADRFLSQMKTLIQRGITKLIEDSERI